jgi:predicted HicB family RNase H-like nuclease
MAKKNIKKGLQEILEFARKLSKTSGLTWVDANNAIYGPDGPVVRLFTTKAERSAYLKTEECKQIDELIDSLPEPPIQPDPRAYSGKFNVRIPKSLHAMLVNEAEAEGVSLNQLVLAKLALHLQVR